MLTYPVIQELTRFNVDLAKAQQYYLSLEKDYQHKKWLIDAGSGDRWGWSIQILHGVSGLFGFYDMNTEPVGSDLYYRSETCFGWAEDILNIFPYGYRAVISVNSPGVTVPSHIDSNGLEMMRVQIPVFTHEKAVWTLDGNEFHMKQGVAYLVNTSVMHGTVNNSDVNRVHFSINIPMEYVPLVLENYL